MFSLHQSDELFQFASTLNQDHKIQRDLLQLTPSVEVSELPLSPESSRRRSSADLGNKDETSNDNKKKKKIMHREMERQRRQEMAALYASLRSLLPPEYLKGKRSLPDQINGVTSYIQNLQKKIKELSEKRDELKRLSNLTTVGVATASLQDCVSIRPCWAGAEVVIRSSLRREMLPLSRVMEELADEETSVTTCISTSVNGSSLHIIQTEISNSASLDLLRLQQKLTDTIQSGHILQHLPTRSRSDY